MLKRNLLLGVVEQLVLDSVFDTLLYAGVLCERQQRAGQLRRYLAVAVRVQLVIVLRDCLLRFLQQQQQQPHRRI